MLLLAVIVVDCFVSISATDYPVPYMVIANRNAIQRVNLDETQFETLISSSEILNNTVAIDFDIRLGLLYTM